MSDIVAYIRNSLQNSVAEVEIYDALKKSGLNHDEINQAFNLVKNPPENIPPPLPPHLSHHPRHSWSDWVIWLFLLLVIVACVFTFFFWNTIETKFFTKIFNYNIVLDNPSSPGKYTALVYGSKPEMSNADFFTKTKDDFVIQQADFIEANLTEKYLRVWMSGEVALDVPILSSGREDSWWETPAGVYRVLSKTENHFSSIGHVWMPYSLNFQGNFFIHGETLYPDGTPTSADFTGGCIRLATEDAKAVFDMVHLGQPVLVFEQSFVADNFNYSLETALSKSYLIADLKNNTVLDYKDTKKKLPIASITKLMTALVALEYINIENLATVPDTALVYTSKAHLEAGRSYSIYQLLFPLLLESSNEAAETIASYTGKKIFVERMNSKAQAIGMNNTIFTDTSGVDAENISTAEDLFLLAKYIYNNRKFIFEITAGHIKNITAIYGKPIWEDLGNYNSFAGDPRLIGGKNGQTSAALETNLSVLEMLVGNTKRPIVLIVLGADDSDQETRKLADWFERSVQ